MSCACHAPQGASSRGSEGSRDAATALHRPHPVARLLVQFSRPRPLAPHEALMRPSHRSLLALALALLLVRPSAAEPMRQLVIQVASDRGEAPLAARRERLATSLQALSL